MGNKSPCLPHHDLIVEMAAAGQPCTAIAKRLGLPTLTVGYYMKTRGIQSRWKRGMPLKLNDDRLRELMALGWTQAQVADELGVHRSAVERRCRILQIQTARTGPRSGQDHPNWAGGRKLDKHGYIQIWAPLHPTARKNGYVPEHRLMAEVTLGRYLRREEVVDHLDDHPQHNWPANLRVYPTNADHLKATLTGREKATPRRSIPGAYGNSQTIDRCPGSDETLAQCPSETRRALDEYIQRHRPTKEHRTLSRAALREQALAQQGCQSASTG